MGESLFIETGSIKPKNLIKKDGRKRVKVPRISPKAIRKIENAYAVVALVATGAGAWKLATLPKVHTQHGLLPVWQCVAGVIAAGLLYSVYILMEPQETK